jgi:hypothetical protein
MLNIDKNIFDENLLLTQAYCELQLKNTYKNYASILRSFNPVYEGKELFSFEFKQYSHESGIEHWFSTEWNLDPLENKLYDDLFEKQLKNKKEIIANIDPGEGEYKGRILIAELDLTVLDGGSEAKSNGLIDSYDCPPIDNWFYKTKNENGHILLFAWIPEPFVFFANEGIEVNCVNCLNWYLGERSESSNWHAENLGEAPKAVVAEDENPQSVFSQIKKLFS